MSNKLTKEQQDAIDGVLEMLPRDEKARTEALEEIARVEELLKIKQPA